MTRDEATKIAWTEEIEDFVYLIYKEFDAQRCENCRYYDHESGDCEPLEIAVDGDFGCRDFVKKGKK